MGGRSSGPDWLSQLLGLESSTRILGTIFPWKFIGTAVRRTESMVPGTDAALPDVLSAFDRSCGVTSEVINWTRRAVQAASTSPAMDRPVVTAISPRNT